MKKHINHMNYSSLDYNLVNHKLNAESSDQTFNGSICDYSDYQIKVSTKTNTKQLNTSRYIEPEMQSKIMHDR